MSDLVRYHGFTWRLSPHTSVNNGYVVYDWEYRFEADVPPGELRECFVVTDEMFRGERILVDEKCGTSFRLNLSIDGKDMFSFLHSSSVRSGKVMRPGFSFVSSGLG